MKHLTVCIEISDEGRIEKVSRINLAMIYSPNNEEIKEEEYGIDTGRTNHRAWQVSDEVLILEDKE